MQSNNIINSVDIFLITLCYFRNHSPSSILNLVLYWAGNNIMVGVDSIQSGIKLQWIPTKNTSLNLTYYIFGPLFTGSMEIYHWAKYSAMLDFEINNFWWSYRGGNYLVSDEPIYCYLTLCSKVRKCDIIKTRTYTSSYA